MDFTLYKNDNTINEITNLLKNNEVMLLKFDEENSKYDEYFNSLNFKVCNITDKEIIEFYDIEILPTVLVYKNNNLIDSFSGFYTKTSFIKKINLILS